MPDTRPVIINYRSVSEYVNAMLHWLRESEDDFTVRRACRDLRRCSPALVTQVRRGRRRLTLDRVPEFGRLLRLQTHERAYLEQWVRWEGATDTAEGSTKMSGEPHSLLRKRKAGSNDLLSDWLNVYIRDACRLRGFKADPQVIHRLLGGIASVRHIERSLNFLLREGYLRRTLDGRIVEHEPFITTTDDQIDRHLQAFHRQALQLARNAVGLYPLERRRESALIIRLNSQSVQELRGLLKEFYERLLLFADRHVDEEETLYQVLINLCPIGGHQHEGNSA